MPSREHHRARVLSTLGAAGAHTYHDAYPLGAKVTHKGKTWTSTTAANIWEPGVYGWV